MGLRRRTYCKDEVLQDVVVFTFVFVGFSLLGYPLVKHQITFDIMRETFVFLLNHLLNYFSHRLGWGTLPPFLVLFFLLNHHFSPDSLLNRRYHRDYFLIFTPALKLLLFH